MIDFGKGPLIMGVVNVTPDSFSDGGKFIDPDKAVAHGLSLIAEGADILDIGGESTRPGAAPVTPDEEQARVIPVIEGLKGSGVMISIDTRHAPTMKKAVAAGADIINDVSGLTGQDSLMTAAELGVPVCLMHMQGDPQTMQNNPTYEDVTTEVHEFLKRRVVDCCEAGILEKNIIVDPGIGFGKGLQHNIELIQNVAKLRGLGGAVMVGLSRKRFIKEICQDVLDLDEPTQRLPGSLAAALWCLHQGVTLFRVHDVKETKQAFAVYEAILSRA